MTSHNHFSMMKGSSGSLVHHVQTGRIWIRNSSDKHIPLSRLVWFLARMTSQKHLSMMKGSSGSNSERIWQCYKRVKNTDENCAMHYLGRLWCSFIGLSMFWNNHTAQLWHCHHFFSDFFPGIVFLHESSLSWVVYNQDCIDWLTTRAL